MKNTLTLLFLFVACNIVAYGQEICDNGIDDDGDGFIDLNDDECDCVGFEPTFLDIIQNPSFEERTCCPTSFSQLHCAESWMHGSDATADYFNTCDFDQYTGGIAPELPLPGEPDGEGFAGFIIWEDFAPGDYYYNEYVGTDMLLSPLLAETAYTLKLWTSRSVGDEVAEITLFGAADVEDMDWGTYECPIEIGSWQYLASQEVTYTLDGAWQQISLTFTPTVDINAIVIGGPCDLMGAHMELSYYYIDELTLESNRTSIIQTGETCINNLVLTGELDTTLGDVQWYKDGIALSGETELILEINTYGAGTYSLVHTLGAVCERSDWVITDDLPEMLITYTMTEEDLGADGAIDITVSDGTSPYEYDWDIDGTGDFDDDEDLTDLVGGTYIVEVKDSLGCTLSEAILVVSPLGIETNLKLDLAVYPNPASNDITISLQDDYTYQLTSLNGSLVLTGSGSNQKTVSLENVAAGTYFLRVENESGIETIKLVKQP